MNGINNNYSITKVLHIIDHPLVQNKLSIMRDRGTSTMKFRTLLEEIAMLMGYEITRDLPLTYEDFETPLMSMKAPKIAGKEVVVVLAMLSHASKPMVTHRFVSFVSCPLHRVCRPYRNNIPM